MKKLYLLLVIAGNINCYNSFQLQLAKKEALQGKVVNISRCDFRGCGSLLTGVNFTGAQAAGVLFKPTEQKSTVPGIVSVPGQISDLSGVNFSQAELVGASFEQANLKGSDFTGANIAYANFAKTNLTGAKLDKALNVETAQFCDAIMPDGVVCKSGTWKSKSGKVFNCRCRKSS